MIRYVLALFVSLTSTDLVAQEVLGRAIIDGREIAILDNGKWRYSEELATDCTHIANGIQFCGEAYGWTATQAPNADVTAQHRFDDRHYGQIIVEELGLNDGMTLKFMRSAVVENAATTTGQNVSDIVILDHFDSEIDGNVARTIVYQFDIDGLEVVFANGIVTSPTRTLQVMTFSVNTELTERHLELHAEYLSHYFLTL